MTQNRCDYSPSTYSVFQGGANGTLAPIAPGPAGYILSSPMGGGALAYTNANEAWELLSTASPSSAASVAFTSLITTVANVYVVTFSNVQTLSGAGLYMTISSDNGSSYSSTNYLSGVNYIYGGQTAFTNFSTGGTTAFLISEGGSAGGGFSGMVWLYNFGNTVATVPTITASTVAQGQLLYASGINTYPAPYNAIKFTGGGVFLSGTISLYRIRS